MIEQPAEISADALKAAGRGMRRSATFARLGGEMRRDRVEHVLGWRQLDALRPQGPVFKWNGGGSRSGLPFWCRRMSMGIAETALKLRYEDTLRELEEQKATITSFHTRASQLLAAATVAIGLVITAASRNGDGELNRGWLIVAAVLFVQGLGAIVWVLRPREWHWSRDTADWVAVLALPDEPSMYRKLVEHTADTCEGNTKGLSAMSQAYFVAIGCFAASVTVTLMNALVSAS